MEHPVKDTAVLTAGIVGGLSLQDVSSIAAIFSYLVAAIYGIIQIIRFVRGKKEPK